MRRSLLAAIALLALAPLASCRAILDARADPNAIKARTPTGWTVDFKTGPWGGISSSADITSATGDCYYVPVLSGLKRNVRCKAPAFVAVATAGEIDPFVSTQAYVPDPRLAVPRP